MKFSDALAPIDDVGEKVMDTTEEYVKKADDVILGRVMRVMDHVSIHGKTPLSLVFISLCFVQYYSLSTISHL